MTDHEKKIEIMRKYYKEIETSPEFFIKGEIPSKRVDNALEKFASGIWTGTSEGFCMRLRRAVRPKIRW
ncbi:MAG TPA: hypothetical protein H9926_03650 [Candidatus Eisenbergiella intestinigallinarum]|uniref:Uncharacterized protein n=1 Tax=Candidatus Eisenbergiella intestinigallinarum TaxID=2838549 RepID=A0A9D2QGC1_9FIRM|nr:hypothetical protein [Candidatus Eisenbergiella intestinigallinarum]